MPSLQQLRYLVAVSETLHFRKAADQTHVSQPTLSAQLRELEGKLGVQLVERSRSRVILTPIGAEVARRAQRVLRDVEDLVTVARQEQAPLAGTIRIGLVQSLGGYFLPLVIPSLHQAFPALKFYIREGPPLDLMERLETGDLDLLFYPLSGAHPNLTARALFREPLLAVLPATHPLAQASLVAPHDLRGQTVLTLEPEHHLHDMVARICTETGARLSLDYGSTSLDTLRQMVATELGITLLPALYVRSEVARETLVVARPFVDPAPARDIGVLWRATSARENSFDAIAMVIRETLAETAPEITVIR